MVVAFKVIAARYERAAESGRAVPRRRLTNEERRKLENAMEKITTGLDTRLPRTIEDWGRVLSIDCTLINIALRVLDIFALERLRGSMFWGAAFHEFAGQKDHGTIIGHRWPTHTGMAHNLRNARQILEARVLEEAEKLKQQTQP